MSVKYQGQALVEHLCPLGRKGVKEESTALWFMKDKGAYSMVFLYVCGMTPTSLRQGGSLETIRQTVLESS